jgi:hypothetical protein
MKRSLSLPFFALLLISRGTQAWADWLDAPHISPFEDVRWRDEIAEVKVEGQWFELVSLNDLTAAQIVAGCKDADRDKWQKRFSEDLVAVLRRMGHDPGTGVTLTLKDLQSGDIQTLPNVEMTKENRRATMENQRKREKDSATRPASTNPSDQDNSGGL